MRQPRIALLAISDGRTEYHERSAESFTSSDTSWLAFVVHVNDAAHELGFGGAIREGWRRVLETDAEYVFHLEMDFTFDRPVPVTSMIRVLERNPHLAQIALMRQPVNEQEKAAGSLYALLRDQVTLVSRPPAYWLEHTRNFTTNPCVYPRWVCERGWPDESESEGKFGIYLLRDRPETRFAYWGRGEQWCTHIGHERTGTGY